MAFLGADWSYARPGGAACAAAGVKSVGRYLAPFGDGREIEKDEYDDLTAHGITVWFVREGAANSLLDGYATGVSHAQTAVANLARLGLNDQVVYAAADFDVQDSQFPACDDYMRGFASVIGLDKTGIYGGLHYINHCRDTLAKWYWKAGASSWDHDETGMVHIEQTTQTPPLPGTDHNYIYTDAHGQVGSAAPVEESKMAGKVSSIKTTVDGKTDENKVYWERADGSLVWIQSPNDLSLLQRYEKASDNNSYDHYFPGELDRLNKLYLSPAAPIVSAPAIDYDALSAAIVKNGGTAPTAAQIAAAVNDDAAARLKS